MSLEGKQIIRLTMAQALVKYLQFQYSERDGKTRRLIPAMFGIFGHGNVAGIGQALWEQGQELPLYQPCNEQSMVHTAIGFAKENKRLATLACTASIGPGSTNMITGAATATINRLPVLLLASDYYATRFQGPVLQELEHPISADVSVNDCFRPVSRFFDRITRPEQLLLALPEAMRVLTDPAMTGAVTLSLPQDIQAHAFDYPVQFFKARVWPVERKLPDSQRINAGIKLLENSKNPVMIAGGGVHYSEASEEIQECSKRFGIPVGETFAGKGSIKVDSDLLLGGQGVTGTALSGNIVAQADLVISVGTRLTDFTTGSQSAFANPNVRFISINVCAQDAYKQGALPIVADAREGLRALLKRGESIGIKPRSNYLKRITKIKREWDKDLVEKVFTQHSGETMNQGQLIGVLNEESREGDLVIAAAGTPPGDLHKLWNVSSSAACHLEFGNSCMGYEIPAALGARMSNSKGEVYVLIGDGTYLMNPTELVTALQENLKITVIISENHGFQSIHGLQRVRAGHSFGLEFRHRDTNTDRLEGNFIDIDFSKNAESMGARTWNVRTLDQLREALRESRAEESTCVIVAETEKYKGLPPSQVWWDVAPAEVSQDPITQDLRAKYEEERTRFQHFHYDKEENERAE